MGVDKPGVSNATANLRRATVRAGLAFALACMALLGAAAVASAVPGASPTRLVYAPGKIVPVPASIPHEAGDMVDRRILPDLRWIAERYPIYITDGYSGPLLSGENAGCDECHTKGSDHYNGLAVDLVPVGGGTKCDATWTAITRLALLAEPVQGLATPPFRWVGYDGDAGHGCGHHLHLSWNHAPAPQFQLAEWVEVFPVGLNETAGVPRTKSSPAPKPPPGPSGGISSVRTGGIGPRVID